MPPRPVRATSGDVVARRASLVIEPRTSDIGVARTFAVDLAPLMVPEDRVFAESDADAVALMVSELVGNAVEHGDGAVRVEVTTAGPRIRVEISDSGGGVPERRRAAPGAGSGRGLGIVDALASSWGWQG